MSIRFVPPEGYVSRCAPGPRQEASTGGRQRRRRVSGWFAGIVGASLVVGLVTPALRSVLQSQRKTTCRDNLSMIGLACHDYMSRWESLPPAAITDASGRPLLSWRVAILPELGLGALYRAFRLDEPWDSPHNQALIRRMPAVFQCPEARGAQGTTAYLALHGPQALFDGREGVSQAGVTDGLANTLLVAESDRSVPWTKPEEHEYQPLNLSTPDPSPLPSFGSAHPGGYQALFGDGSVRFLRPTIAEPILRALITRDGGEVLSSD